MAGCMDAMVCNPASPAACHCPAARCLVGTPGAEASAGGFTMKLTTQAFALTIILGSAWPAAACVTDAECSDNSVCTGTETCQAGVCIAGEPLTCSDTDPCTTDGCDASLGCTFTPTQECTVAGHRLKLGARGTNLRMTVQTDNSIAGSAFPQQGGPGDPVIHGASLRLVTEAGDQFDAMYPMPSAGWSYVGGGYLYRDKAGAHGPIKLGLVRDGTPTKIKGGGALGFTLVDNPNPVQVVLRFGNDKRYCLAFGGLVKFTSGAGYHALRAPAPASCPASPSGAFLDGGIW
jgi:hypothetical protein